MAGKSVLGNISVLRRDERNAPMMLPKVMMVTGRTGLGA
jgi:hypothetical protein